MGLNSPTAFNDFDFRQLINHDKVFVADLDDRLHDLNQRQFASNALSRSAAPHLKIH